MSDENALDRKRNPDEREAWAIVHSGNWGCPVRFDRSFTFEAEAIAAWNRRAHERNPDNG